MTKKSMSALVNKVVHQEKLTQTWSLLATTAMPIACNHTANLHFCRPEHSSDTSTLITTSPSSTRIGPPTQK
jgi:hypothetical protein